MIKVTVEVSIPEGSTCLKTPISTCSFCRLREDENSRCSLFNEFIVISHGRAGQSLIPKKCQKCLDTINKGV